MGNEIYFQDSSPVTITFSGVPDPNATYTITVSGQCNIPGGSPPSLSTAVNGSLEDSDIINVSESSFQGCGIQESQPNSGGGGWLNTVS